MRKTLIAAAVIAAGAIGYYAINKSSTVTLSELDYVPADTVLFSGQFTALDLVSYLKSLGLSPAQLNNDEMQHAMATLSAESSPAVKFGIALFQDYMNILSTPDDFVKNTGLAVTIDLGEWNDIHPVDKKTLAERLALAARAVALDEDVQYQGPQLLSVQVQGNKLLLSFDQQLVLKPGQSFAIAGSDGKYRWAQVQLQGKQLVLSHADITAPVQVRYAWADTPDAVLYNSAGLPASPFTAQIAQPK